MSMNVGSTGGLKSEINVTPLVDVVLVLLIIFMVVTPLLQVGHVVDTPPKVDTVIPQPQQNQVIVRIDEQGKTYINQEEIPYAQFGIRLEEVMKNRSRRLVFFAADGDLTYEKVARFLDLCRNHGAAQLGIVFEDMKTK